MDEHWSYKNFNMVVELDIAGEFIYNGIHEIYRVSHFANDGSTFTALYDTSVGIGLLISPRERLGKHSILMHGFIWSRDPYILRQVCMKKRKKLLKRLEDGIRLILK